GHGRGLFEWLRGRPPGARVPGFTDHLWVGSTTLQVARLCHLLISEDVFESAAEGHIHHFCPCAPLSKFELVTGLAAALGLDVEVNPVESGRPVTRQLDTEQRVLAGLVP